MNRLEAAKRKRLRRDVASRIRAANKVAPTENEHRVLAMPNHAARQRARKFLAARPDLTISLRESMAAVPVSWKERVTINLQPGTYHVGTAQEEK